MHRICYCHSHFYSMHDINPPHTTSLTDARSLIQWLLEFRPQDRPNLEHIVNHPWLKTAPKATPKSPHSPCNNKTTLSSPQKKNLITASTTVSPLAVKSPGHQSSSLTHKETTRSPTHRASGGRVPNTPCSPFGSPTSYFTPPQGRMGVKYSIPPPSSSPRVAQGSSSPLHRNTSSTLPPVSPAHTSSIHTHSGGGRVLLQGQSQSVSKPSVLRRFMSPVSRPASYCGGGVGPQGVTCSVREGVVQSGTSRTQQLLMGRKQFY